MSPECTARALPTGVPAGERALYTARPEGLEPPVAWVAWVARGVRAADGPKKEGVFWMRGFLACVAVGLLVLGVPLLSVWAKAS